MPNMSLKKNPMPSQAADVRNKNFLEVALGYSEEQAVDEANRCLNCKNKPCVGGCPVNIDIPAFIARIRERDFEGAYQIITKSSSLPAVCGRVCPQETQCEHKCVRGIKGEPVIRATSSSSSTTPGSAINARHPGKAAANSSAIKPPRLQACVRIA